MIAHHLRRGVREKHPRSARQARPGVSRPGLRGIYPPAQREQAGMEASMPETQKQPAPVEFAKAIADTTRQKIMKFCCCDWRSVTDIVDHMQVTQPTVSHHLAILRDAGLVAVRHEGKQTFYTLNQERVATCCGVIMKTFAPETEATEAVQKTISES